MRDCKNSPVKERFSPVDCAQREKGMPAALSLSVVTVPSWSLRISDEDDDVGSGVRSSSVMECFNKTTNGRKCEGVTHPRNVWHVCISR